MKLSKEQRDKLIEFLNTKRITPNCPLCNSITWGVSDTIFEMREFQGGNLNLGGNQNIFPVIPINCTECGNTIFLNAMQVGVLDPQNIGGQND